MEFILVLFIIPIIVIAVSIFGYILLKKWFVVPVVTFLVFIVLMLAVLNETFFIWVVIYTIISIIISLIMKLFKK